MGEDRTDLVDMHLVAKAIPITDAQHNQKAADSVLVS